MQPDVVLFDAIMPEMDGFDTCQNSKKSSPPPHFFMTGWNDSEHVIHGFEVVVSITSPNRLCRMKFWRESRCTAITPNWRNRHNLPSITQAICLLRIKTGPLRVGELYAQELIGKINPAIFWKRGKAFNPTSPAGSHPNIGKSPATEPIYPADPSRICRRI